MTARSPRRLAVGVIVATAVWTGLPARAEGWDATAGIVSDHVYRGISQSRGRAALLLGTRYATDGGWSVAGEVASAGSGGDADLAVGLSRHWQVDSDWSVRARVEYDAYLGSAQRRRYDRSELGASLSWQGRWFAAATVSPDTSTFYGTGRRHSGPALAIETGWRERLGGRLALDAGIGYYLLHRGGGGGYPYASVGLSSGVGPVQLHLAAITSRAAQRGLAPASVAGNRVAASALWSF